MAVNRVWFPNAPSGSINAAQRSQLAIGYSIGVVSVVTEVVVSFIDYLRRYLLDTPILTPSVVIEPTIVYSIDSTANIRYYRRYLIDTVIGG